MRKKRYKGKEGFIYGESGNLPEWCDGNARELWYQSDRFERANGVTSRKIEFSLQTEIKDIELQKKLIRDVIRVASHGDGLPYSFAVHNSADGHNPHVHIMISERIPDDLYKTPEHYFKRYNGRNPKKGGCRKSPKLKTREHVQEVRQAIADFTNKLFKLLNIDTHIDPRSYKEQGIDKIPMPHLGPQLIEMENRGVKSHVLQEKLQLHRTLVKRVTQYGRRLEEQSQKSIRKLIMKKKAEIQNLNKEKPLKKAFKNGISVPLEKILKASDLNKEKEYDCEVLEINENKYAYLLTGVGVVRIQEKELAPQTRVGDNLILYFDRNSTLGIDDSEERALGR